MASERSVNWRRALQVWADLGGFIRANSLQNHLYRTLDQLSDLLGSDEDHVWELDEKDNPTELGSNKPPSPTQLALISRGVTNGLAVVVREGEEKPSALALPVAEARVVFTFESSASLALEEGDTDKLAALGSEIALVNKEFDLQFRSQKEHRDRENRLREQARDLRKLLRRRQAPIGQHKTMQSLVASANRIGTSTLPVLITGETGTGKEELARFIHRISKRPKPMVVVDCGAIPASLLESELFGAERGAFTGATARRVGRFEEADGGTLLLDEIGELPIALQPKLLRVLQDSRIRRVGGSSEIELDLRIISATHRDLREMVAAGTFREDLFFRLKVVELSLPPLRDRGDDVILLANHFIRQYSAELGREFLGLSPAAQDKLMSHDWHGNVRELQNTLRSALLTAQSLELTADDIVLEEPPRRRRKSREPQAPRERTKPTSTSPPADLTTRLYSDLADWFWSVWSENDSKDSPWDALEGYLLRTALVRSRGSLSEAGSLVGLTAETFGRHLDRLGGIASTRTIRSHALADSLPTVFGNAHPRDDVLALVLTELLVHCRGNKSEMARILSWGRATLGRELVRLSIVGAATNEASNSSD